MIYLLYGTEKHLIENYIKKIKKENNIEEFSTTIHDIDDGINNIIDDANSIDMFGNTKLIIVNNSYIFTGVKQEVDIEPIFSYIKNPNPSTILIFIVDSEKLDERKKITKEIKNIAITKDFNEFDNNTLKEMFGEYKIDNYILSLIESIVSKDKEKAVLIYNEMIKMNEEPIKIIVMLANQFRLIYQSKQLYKKGYSGNDIATLLDIHPYRIKLAIEKGRNYSEKDLLDNLYKLATLDEEIKTGKKDKYLALELFLISI